jgi:two-component system chemotaxis response regulator CheB
VPTGPSLSQPSPTVAAGDIGDEVRVVVVDDSAVIRRVLAGVIKQAAGVTLVGQAINGREALTVIETEHPDIVVLDVEMPVLDGLGALREAKRRWPGLPIVMFSTLTEAGAAATLKALSEGADDYLTKPISTNGPVGAFDAVREQLVPLLVAWGEIGRQRAARRGARRESDNASHGPMAPGPPAPGRASSAPEILAPTPARKVPSTPAEPTAKVPVMVPGRAPLLPAPGLLRPASSEPISRASAPAPNRPAVVLASKTTAQVTAIVLGTSTGGPNALGIVVPALPADLGVPVLIVQHMPPMFTRLLAEHLDARSALTVHEAAPGMVVQPGHVYVAAGGSHMVVKRSREHVVIELDDGPPENCCKPSVDVLFRSAVTVWKAGLLAVMLTGMGQDGLVGSRAIISAGGTLIAQDEGSSVVWGMPGAVIKAGLASEVVPLADVSAIVVRRARPPGRARGPEGKVESPKQMEKSCP